MPDFIQVQGNGQTQTPRLAQTFAKFPNEGAQFVRGRMEPVTAEFRDTMKGRSSAGPLRRRSGRLDRSWSNNVNGNRLAEISGDVGSFVFYAQQHDVGGTFTPRKALWFWIPVGPNLNAKRRAKVSIAKAQEHLRTGFWRFTNRNRGSDDRTVFGKTAGVLNEDDELVYVLTRSKTLKPVLEFDRFGIQFDAALVTLVTADFDRFFEQNP